VISISAVGSVCLRAALCALAATSLLACDSRAQPQAPQPRRHLLILVDGLRPDYVTGEVMPNLTALGRRGVIFNKHHSVYPTVTRVNASSISTGAYPQAHGLLGNSVFFPTVNASKFLDTGDRNDLLEIAATEQPLLTATTLGESLRAVGRKMLVVSSGSSGSAFLNNHTVAGGAILHDTFVLPESLRSEMAALGPPPAAGAPAGARDAYAVDALLKVGLPRVDPTVTVLWLSDLDSTAHDRGIGDPATIEVLRHVDQEIKRIEDGLRATGLLDSYNIWVTSDHGFSTYTGAIDLPTLLKPFARARADGAPSIISGTGAIYVRDDEASIVPAIAKALQQTSGVGAVFTRAAQPGSFDGQVPGTLSFEAVRWNHDRSAQLLFSPDWTDAANARGFKGTSASNGTAGHGSSSPWDVHNTLIAAGPDLKRGITVDVPSANVDFAPTFLRLLGIATPASMQGRALEEALSGGAAADVKVWTMEHTVRTGEGSYTLTGMFSIVSAGGREYRYFDGTKVVRQ
jgi:predicted AlkP superfamily pyrophosphatase or phosphodiesterase